MIVTLAEAGLKYKYPMHLKYLCVLLFLRVSFNGVLSGTAKGEYFDLLFSTDNNVNGAGFYATYTIQDGTITDFPPSVEQSNSGKTIM